MPLDVGRKPEYLRLHLIPNSPFSLEMECTGTDQFPEAPSFVFPVSPDTSYVWIATLSGDRKVASWSVESDDVDEVIGLSTSRKARLLLGQLVWAEGKFEVDRD